jgi:hypothetical protein
MKKIYAILLGLLIANISIAQTVARYNFSENTASYTAITGGTSYATGVDNGVYGGTANLIPFPFVFNGTAYTTFYVSSNGFITLGNTSVPSGTNYTPISNSATTSNNVIAALGTNLRSDVRYEVVGSSPNREAVIQWSNATSVAAFSPDGLRFQIRLFETSHTIKIVYGSMFINLANLTTAEVGLRGAANTDFNNRGFISSSITANSWDKTIFPTANNAQLTITQSLFPATGKTFTYLPSSCSQPTTNGTATSVTNTSFNIGWTDDAAYASGYQVRWRRASDLPTVSSWVTPTAVAAGSSSYTVTGLTANTHYVYSVEGLCSGLSFSNLSQVTTANSTNSKGLVQTAQNPMTYVSSVAAQPLQAPIAVGSNAQEILRIAVTVNGNVSPLTVSQLNFTTNGSSLPADISAANVYYTGTSNVFSTATAFGTAFTNPSGAFSITGSQTLSGTAGTAINYFWLTYDVPCGSTIGNFLDAEYTGINVGVLQTPTTTAPSGVRQLGTFEQILNVQPVTSSVSLGGVDNPVLQIPIVGASCPVNFTQFNFTNNSTNVLSTTQAKLFYTTTPTFSNAVQFGSTVVSPGATFSISGSLPSASSGTNYFWLAFDVACNATVGNVIDGGCTSINYSTSAGSIIPFQPNPPGTRAIAVATNFNTVADGEWSNPSIWACGNRPTNSTTPVLIKHNVTVSDLGNIGGNVTVTSGKTLTVNNGGSLTIGN